MRSGIVILAGMACLLPRAGLALEANEIFKRTDPSIVVITTTDKNGKDARLGSGVLVAPRDVVTNCHVVKDAAAIVVKQPGVQRSGKLRYQDTARDLCQIQLDDALPAGKPVSAMRPSAELEVGQPVYAIGAPQGLDRTLSRGIISALRDMKDNARLIQTDASVTNGSSGGGLFDSEGRLIGIVTFIIGEEGNLNFAIPTDWIEQLASRNRDRASDPVTSAAPGNNSSAQPPAGKPREAWMPNPGDRWKYKLSYDKQVMGIVAIQVLESSASSIRERVTFDRSRSFEQQRNADPGFNPGRFQTLVTLPGGYQLAEISPYISPDTDLQPGKRWSDIPGEFTIQGSARRSLVSDMRLVGREQVRVPAGEFNAWKFETTSNHVDHNGVFFTIKCIFWYAPEMKRSVRMQVVTESSVAVLNHTESYDLSAFEPGK